MSHVLTDTETNHLTKDAKWIIGLIIPLMVSTLTGVYFLGTMSQRFYAVERATEKLNRTLENLVVNEMADMKERIRLIEAKDILPRAEIEIKELKERVRHLELSLNNNRTSASK